MPKSDIIKFLNHISVSENLNMSEQSLGCIQKLYRSDIRSMINFMQSNQDITNTNFNIIDDNVWSELFSKLEQREKLESICDYVVSIRTQYNIDTKNIIKDFLNYIIRNSTVTPEFLSFVENLIHSENSDNQIHLLYSLSRLSTFLAKGSINGTI